MTFRHVIVNTWKGLRGRKGRVGFIKTTASFFFLVIYFTSPSFKILFFCSSPNVLLSCLHFPIQHNYTNNHFSTTHSHAHSRVDNAPPGSGRAVGWGRTGTSVNLHSDRRSPSTRGRLGNRTDTDPEIKHIT